MGCMKLKMNNQLAGLHNSGCEFEGLNIRALKLVDRMFHIIWYISLHNVAVRKIIKLKLALNFKTDTVCMCSGRHVCIQHCCVNTEEQRRDRNSTRDLQQHGGTTLLAGKSRRSQGNSCHRALSGP